MHGCCNNVVPHAKAPAQQSVVPDEGWNEENLRTPNGRRLLRDLVRDRNVIVARGIKATATFLLSFFDEEFEELLRLVTSYYDASRGRKGPTMIGEAGEHVHIWGRAMDENARKYDAKLVMEVTPKIHTTSKALATQVAKRLGGKITPALESAVRVRSNQLARQVKGIADTTRQRLASALAKCFNEGKNIDDTFAYLRKTFPRMNRNRVMTIARTEMGRAADIAQTAAYEQSGVVTYVSVVGCQAIERGIPTYNGIPTCNIKYVPIYDAHKLHFHPNHTGTIVPSGFFKRDGSYTQHRTRGGKPTEKEDRERQNRSEAQQRRRERERRQS